MLLSIVIEFCLWASVWLGAGAAWPLHKQAQNYRWGEWWKHAYWCYLMCHQGSRASSCFFSYLFSPSFPSPFLPCPFFSLSIPPPPPLGLFTPSFSFSLPLPISLVCILPWSQGVSGCRTELLPASYPPPHSSLPHASVQLSTTTGIQHPTDLSHSKHSARALVSGCGWSRNVSHDLECDWLWLIDLVFVVGVDLASSTLVLSVHSHAATWNNWSLGMKLVISYQLSSPFHLASSSLDQWTRLQSRTR